MRGGEKVLELLCEAYPDADLLTLFHVPGSVSPAIERLRPRASVLQRIPGARRFYRYCLPLFPIAIEQFDLDEYDLVVSTSHCAAKSVIKTGRARHLCYCFTPMRYAWDQFDAYFGKAASDMALLRPRWGRWPMGCRHGWARRPLVASLSTLPAGSGGLIIGTLTSSTPVDTGFYSPDDTVAPKTFC
jgi:hypothetical protein